jgi:hypothetical protein
MFRRPSLPVIANGLNLSRAEVHGVVSFYHDYREAPAGRHVIKLCRAEACQSMGGDELAERLLGLLGLDWHETGTDRNVTIEPVYCLGLCACAPAAMVDGEVIGRLDAETVDRAGEGGAGMSVKIYIPGDSGSVALGADRLAIRMAEALKARDLDAEIVRNGSRGLYWLEPMVEVETGSRAGWPMVRSRPSDVDGLLEAGLLEWRRSSSLTRRPTGRACRFSSVRHGLHLRAAASPIRCRSKDYRDHGGLTGLTNAGGHGAGS